jgi:AcrR family transcriptional regulator
MDFREKLLEAAAKVFAESGYRGATTRRIAQQAGVSEITLFRHFGSKDALILEALRETGSPNTASQMLPEVPNAPFEELFAWARAQHAHLSERRSLIRSCMGEMAERPDVGRPATRHPAAATAALAQYLTRLRELGFTSLAFEPRVPAWMLLASVFGDAMWRDVMPEIYGESAEQALAGYVRLTLKAVGVEVPAEEHADGDRETPARPARTA